jgi:hypothetical protein
MSLDDFELAAREAERILKLLRTSLCALPAGCDAGGSLRATLAAGTQLEIAAIYFTRDDATRADVNVQTAAAAGDADTAPAQRWVLKLERSAQGWRVASVVPAT